MGHKDLTLLAWKLVQSRIEFFDQKLVSVSRLRTRVRRGQQVLPAHIFVPRRGPFNPKRLPGSLPEEVRNPVPSHAKEPGANLAHGPPQAIRLHEFKEDILENILDVVFVRHPPADEIT